MLMACFVNGGACTASSLSASSASCIVTRGVPECDSSMRQLLNYIAQRSNCGHEKSEMGEPTLPLLSRREVEALIAEGGLVFVLDQFVIRANPWVPYHPGGEKAIMHMVGRDATDEVSACV